MVEKRGCHRGTIAPKKQPVIDLFEYKTKICPRGKECQAVYCWHTHEDEEMREFGASMNSDEKELALQAWEYEKEWRDTRAPYKRKLNPFTGRATIREHRKTQIAGDALDISVAEMESDSGALKDRKIDGFA